MKKLIIFVLSIVALSTTAMAQSKKNMPNSNAGVVKVVTEAEFMANPAAFNGATITIKNVSLRPRKDIRDECRKHPTGDKGIAVEFASNPKWEAACFSILEADKTTLLATQGPTKADITLKGNADKGFRIISYIKL